MGHVERELETKRRQRKRTELVWTNWAQGHREEVVKSEHEEDFREGPDTQEVKVSVNGGRLQGWAVLLKESS